MQTWGSREVWGWRMNLRFQSLCGATWQDLAPDQVPREPTGHLLVSLISNYS